MANEPSFVDGGDAPTGRPIYYHSGLDIGGCEGLVDVVSASDGLVVSAGGKALPEYPDIPFYKRADYDYVYVLDSQGWFYRYAHLKSIDPAIRPGERVKMGQKIGVLGKEGSSGGWSHLHFDIKARQPSGKWGIQEGYAFLWEAYRREHKPQVLAVARPHHLASVGEKVVAGRLALLERAGEVARFEWTFGDGGTADGPRVEHSRAAVAGFEWTLRRREHRRRAAVREHQYNHPGSYSKVIKVTDARGRVSWEGQSQRRPSTARITRGLAEPLTVTLGASRQRSGLDGAWNASISASSPGS